MSRNGSLIGKGDSLPKCVSGFGFESQFPARFTDPFDLTDVLVIFGFDSDLLKRTIHSIQNSSQEEKETLPPPLLFQAHTSFFRIGAMYASKKRPSIHDLRI